MKKPSSKFVSNYEYQRQPWALATHVHSAYLEADDAEGVTDGFVLTADSGGVVWASPPGGVGGTIVFVQESAPNPAVSGDLWLVESTGILSIRKDTVWEEIVYRTQLADDGGTLDINAGYF